MDRVSRHRPDGRPRARRLADGARRPYRPDRRACPARAGAARAELGDRIAIGKVRARARHHALDDRAGSMARLRSLVGVARAGGGRHRDRFEPRAVRRGARRHARCGTPWDCWSPTRPKTCRPRLPRVPRSLPVCNRGAYRSSDWIARWRPSAPRSTRFGRAICCTSPVMAARCCPSRCDRRSNCIRTGRTRRLRAPRHSSRSSRLATLPGSRLDEIREATVAGAGHLRELRRDEGSPVERWLDYADDRTLWSSGEDADVVAEYSGPPGAMTIATPFARQRGSRFCRPAVRAARRRRRTRARRAWWPRCSWPVFGP